MKEARKYVIRGRVQGVGFRYFVERSAKSLGLTGWARNRPDGTVEVYAAGVAEQLKELSGILWKGPPSADVRGVEEQAASLETADGFRIR